MLSTLDDAGTLQRRARRPLVLAAAITGGAISPLVVAIFDSMFIHDDWTIRGVTVWYGWCAIIGTVLATLAVRRAWRSVAAPLGRSVVGWSALAGLALPALLCAPFFVFASRGGFGDLIGFVLIGAPLFALCASFASVPTGAVLGLVFCSGIGLARDRITRPAHDTVAHAWASATAMLAIATAASVLVASLVESAYCYELFFRVLPALDIVPAEGTDAAWTRFVVLPAPLALATLAFAATAAIGRWRLARVASAILSGTHPLWMADGAMNEALVDVLPLRDRDRGAGVHTAIRAREKKSDTAYRAADAPVAFISR